MTIAIRNCIIITQNGARETIRGSIEIEGNIISKVARGSSHIDTSDIVIDGDSHIAMPGLINTHTHVGMSAVRGNVETKNLDAFLKDTEEFDRRNNERRIEASTLISVAEMLRTGTTAFLDLYYSEDVIAKVVSKIGMRAYLAWVVLDKEFTTQKGNPIDNARRFVESRLRSSIIKPAFGLQGVYVCSKETISKTEELAAKYNTVLHMHLSETKEEVIGSLKRYGKRPVEWLYGNGLLSKRLVAAHAVWLENKEIKMLAKSGVTVSYNVASNMRLGSGRARIERGLKHYLCTNRALIEFTREGPVLRAVLSGFTVNDVLEGSAMKIIVPRDVQTITPLSDEELRVIEQADPSGLRYEEGYG